MATFIYTGEPTAGISTKDIKVPKADGSFQVFTNITPNTTELVTTDATSVAYLQNNPNFSEQ